MSEPESLQQDRYLAALNALHIADCALARANRELRISDGYAMQATKAARREAKEAINELNLKTNQ